MQLKIVGCRHRAVQGDLIPAVQLRNGEVAITEDGVIVQRMDGRLYDREDLLYRLGRPPSEAEPVGHQPVRPLQDGTVLEITE